MPPQPLNKMSKRRRTPPPPPFPFPFVDVEDATSADAVLAEEHSEAAASVLQQLLNEVQQWVAAPATARSVFGDVPDVAPLPSRLGEGTRRTFELLREEPDAHTGEAIALGIAWAGDWIEGGRRALRSAIVFYQATLLLQPENVTLAYHIARLLRRIAMYEQAGTWLLHVVEKSAASQDWKNHTLALSGLGNLKRERGNFPDSVRFHRRALASARKWALPRLEGDALYDLAVMYFERGELDTGMGHARGAMKAYGPGHSQLVRMANDLAWIWMHLHGESGLSLMLFQAIEPRVQDPAFRPVLLANIARAAAEVEQMHIYELSWLEAYAYMRRQDTEDGHAAAFGQMALASVAAMQLERARQAASLSRDISRRRRESRLLRAAELILDALRDGVPAPSRMKELFPAFTLHEVEVSEAEQERNEDFATHLSVALRAREDGAPESPMRALVCGK